MSDDPLNSFFAEIDTIQQEVAFDTAEPTTNEVSANQSPVGDREALSNLEVSESHIEESHGGIATTATATATATTSSTSLEQIYASHSPRQSSQPSVQTTLLGKEAVISAVQVISRPAEIRSLPQPPTSTKPATSSSSVSSTQTHVNWKEKTDSIGPPPPPPPQGVPGQYAQAPYPAGPFTEHNSLQPFSMGAMSAPVPPPQAPRQDRKFVRVAAGEVWVDNSLQEWPENDFRIFVGDLGKEVTTEMLAKHFQIYKSFAKAKVVRANQDAKTKGYGFVSFLDPMDCAKAIREMNGKYLGTRPMKISKSTWKDRDMKFTQQKEKKKRKINESLGIEG